MPIVGRLDQYASMLASEFDDYSMSENLLLRSQDFTTTWTLSNISVSSNTVVAPDGTTTAETIQPPVDGLTITRTLRQNPVLTTQQAYTFSVFVKVGTATANGIALYVSDSTATNSFRSNFNLFFLTVSPNATGWAIPTATIVPYPNGWYRCILSGVTSTAHTSLRAIIHLGAFASIADTYGSLHVWGAQLESGSVATDYTPTASTTVSRVLSSTINTNISSTGTYYSSGFDENTGFRTALSANISVPYDPIYDEFGGTLFGAGQGRYMRQYTDKSVVVYNEIDEVTDFRDIVRTGLILDLDAAQPLSYGGTGTTWKDLSSRGNNGTFFGGVTYGSDNGGAIVLNGSSGYVATELVLPSPSIVPTTFDIVYKFLANSDNKGLMGSSSYRVSGFGIITKTSNIGVLYNASGLSYEPSISTDNSVISHITIIFNGRVISFYKNGVFHSSFTASFDAQPNLSPINIGKVNQLGYSFPNANIYSARVYSRALTASEVSQNFNALRNRYGL